jgi:hypothetical protein
MHTLSNNRPLRVTDVGEFIRHDSCERRFKLGLNNRDLTRQLPFFDRFLNTMDPVLKKEGHRRENDWAKSLVEQGIIDCTRQIIKKEELVIGTNWKDVIADVHAAVPGQSLFWREIQLQETVGAFELKGNVDFLLLTWSITGHPIIHVVECKASRRDRTYHRVQVVLYKLLLENMSLNSPLVWQGHFLSPSTFIYRVARIDETNNLNQDILSLPPLDLSMERIDVELLLAPNGLLDTIRQASLDTLPFQLNQKCDGCTFSPHCLTESARQRRLELLGLSSTTNRILRLHGINTLDDLAQIDVNSPVATAIRNALGFIEDIKQLKEVALARTSTLPRGINDPDAFQVSELRNSGKGQLPEHVIRGVPLVRVYLCVEYDYVENRIGALSAHITNSEYSLQTPFRQDDDGRSGPPLPSIMELVPTEHFDDNGELIHNLIPVRGEDVRQIVSSAWTGNYATDSGTEKQLLQSFFNELVGSIASVACKSEAPVHFYVWSRQEMKLLIEACTRVDSRLLSHLRELLGSRQSLEQLLYSSLRDEINQRYTLGWTGRGLGVVSSLRWYGQRYHWTRSVNGQDVKLDEVFTQDIFDFKTTLDYDSNTAAFWLPKDVPKVERHRFEIRSRFNDSLPAPYWRACWNELPETDDLDNRTRRAIRSYNVAAAPNFLREYLRARTHALRWLDEKVRFKNSDIDKLFLPIVNLTRFSLGISNAAQAGIDFLRLDHHVRVNSWLMDGVLPTASRVGTGRTIPLSHIHSDGDKVIHATIDPTPFGLTLEALQSRTNYEVGSFVRISPCDSNPQRGQTIPQLLYGGSTCVIRSIDWQTGVILLDARFGREDAYTLASKSYQPNEVVFEFATLDESMTDFVARRVEDKLRGQQGSYVFQWFDPEQPNIPTHPALPNTKMADLEEFVKNFKDPDGRSLMTDQLTALLEGLTTKIHLLQGPPGTGKTTTTATAILSRIAARHKVGSVLLISANTHTAVDTLLQRISRIQKGFHDQAVIKGITFPTVHLVKMHSSSQNAESVTGAMDWFESNCTSNIKKMLKTGVIIIGGTTNALLKMSDKLSPSASYRHNKNGFQVEELIVDEASMLVFPHFLALSTLVKETGSIMLTGDHRQLPPIVAHDWENEDRPPTVLYQPFLSAYDAIRRLLQHRTIQIDATRMHYSRLTYSFRLPPVIRELIKKLYNLDDLSLQGPSSNLHLRNDSRGHLDNWSSVWANQTGLYLVLHNERISGQSNETEARIIEYLLEAAPIQDSNSVAIIAPHRAQRTLLQTRLKRFFYHPFGMLDLVDTVNRLQGAERPTIIVSAAMSDPSDISANAEFILELNRANVAFSRAKQRLIVVCSESLLNHIPVEADRYQDTLLWKSLRQLCSELVTTQNVDDTIVNIFTPAFDQIESSLTNMDLPTTT